MSRCEDRSAIAGMGGRTLAQFWFRCHGQQMIAEQPLVRNAATWRRVMEHRKILGLAG